MSKRLPDLVTEDRSDGRVMVLSDSLSEPLVRIDGDWLIGTFDADDLKDNFFRVTDSIAATTLVQEAAAALSSNPNLPKA